MKTTHFYATITGDGLGSSGYAFGLDQALRDVMDISKVFDKGQEFRHFMIVEPNGSVRYYDINGNLKAHLEITP